ncbi:MAG: sugar-binding domain-containing protein [Kibdelosporangium sp.]
MTRRLLAAVLVLPLLAVPPLAAPAAARTGFVAPELPGQSRNVPSWRIHPATEGGERISSPGYADGDWLTVPARSTVMAGLIAGGRYPDLNYGTNLQDAVNRADFSVPWWYRQEFTSAANRHTFLRLNGGVISRGEVWLNGTLLGTPIGAYPRHEFDITGLLRPGRNAIAIKAMPADPYRDLTVSFLDWSPPAPDNNMGLWRDVGLATAGDVSLLEPRVLTALTPDLQSATLTAKVELRNNTPAPVTTTVLGTIENRPLSQRVTIPAGLTTITFPPMKIDKPRVWWPAQFGDQPLYRLNLTAFAGHGLSDHTATDFGVREVRSELTATGARQFYVNGKPFGVRGGGWASDLFLRTQPDRLAKELRLARDMGLNTLRLEGKQEDHELLELADQYGIMLLPGWECCTKWEKYTTWTEEDHEVATRSIEAEAKRMVNHPSVLGFFIGSDNAAPARVEKSYIDTLRAADFTAPIIPAAANKATPILGRSGMKMDGPYWWIPPNYWYQDRLGGAAGFASEIGSGPTIPELDTLTKFLTPQEIDDLWRNPSKPQYHLAKKEVFSTLSIFATALARRYGEPKDLADFLRKAQLANYEANRAQFEAYGRDFADPVNPATGMIYWMANNAWPTLYWHLWSHDLATAGSYFGAKKATRPLHVQYSYDDRSVVLANTGLSAADLTVRATAFALDGRVLSDQSTPATADPNTSRRVLRVPAASETYLLRLLVQDSTGREIDRNVYWLSTSDDVLDFGKSTWWHTPATGYADFTALQNLPKATVTTTIRGSEVVLHNNSGTVALAVRADLPGAQWSDNYVTLWPGETLTLQGDRPAEGTRITGYNL